MRLRWSALALLVALSACATRPCPEPATGPKFGDTHFGPRPGGGGISTVSTSGPVSGDGSVGSPVTIISSGLGTGLGISGSTIINTGAFGANTSIVQNDNTATPVTTWQGVSSFTVNTHGATTTKYVMSLMNGGSQVAALTILPAQIQGANGVIGTPAFSFPGSATSGMWFDTTNQRLAFSFNGGAGGSPNLYIGTAGIVIETPSAAAAALYFHGDGANSIVRTGAGGLTITTGGLTVNGNVGFFNGTPVGQQVVGANVNNIVASGTTGQFDDFTSLSVYATDAAAIHADIYQLARSVAQHTVALRNTHLGN